MVAFDGDPDTAQRINATTATGAAVLLSRARFADRTGDAGTGRRLAGWAVLSRDDVFADSLAGSTLTTAGPLLFTRPSTLSPGTAAELSRILAPGAGVFILGGVNAIEVPVADALVELGFSPIRLAGPSRVETSLAVATEVRNRFGSTLTSAVARSDEWADSVAAGGWAQRTATPILLSGGDVLHPAVGEWLTADGTQRTILLGGTAALGPTLDGAVPGPQRVAGDERAGTAAAIARDLFGVVNGLRAYTIIDGDRPDGWAFGLAAAGISGDANAPMLMVRSGQVPASTAEMMESCGDPAVDLLVIGGVSVIGEDPVRQMEQMDGTDCPTLMSRQDPELDAAAAQEVEMARRAAGMHGATSSVSSSPHADLRVERP